MWNIVFASKIMVNILLWWVGGWWIGVTLSGFGRFFFVYLFYKLVTLSGLGLIVNYQWLIVNFVWAGALGFGVLRDYDVVLLGVLVKSQNEHDNGYLSMLIC